MKRRRSWKLRRKTRVTPTQFELLPYTLGNTARFKRPVIGIDLGTGTDLAAWAYWDGKRWTFLREALA
ncbi:hypothetical protein [Sphingomonas colocasiae]|uniref:Uncharacterized protein n=1 Tax=Sphingomonas colocasiae TaxID=1848973 RepID=A0ABS7PXJ8_9SPHN|nr:hypothetical protein [Sphingomonas colocasiae]MBY8826091.1 hypothetical protein [Sphingomonas colocasiae]